MTAMLDFNHNNGFYDKPLIAVWDGRVNDMIPLSNFSPYTLETRASWVPNPSGTPKYYLKLEERFTHIADEKVGAFGFDFAAYADWSLKKKMVSPQNCPCDVSKTKYIAGGFYRDDLSTGLGVAMPARNFSAGRINGGGGTEPMWRNHSFHMSGRDTLEGLRLVRDDGTLAQRRDIRKGDPVNPERAVGLLYLGSSLRTPRSKRINRAQ